MGTITEAVIELPRYECHKKVWALKIKDIQQDQNAKVQPPDEEGVWLLIPEEDGYGPVRVTHEWLARFRPVIGGFYVVYDDGYSSFSPCKAFEEGYTRIEN